MLKGKTVLLGVTGSIAAYKIAGLASMLVKLHANVHVIMTENAKNFITPVTFETLTGNKCMVDTFDRNFQFQVTHIAVAEAADVCLIAPASANVIGKLANGIADDMLTTTVMACKAKVIISPAMNTNMYENPIVQDNLKKLKHYGMEIVEPAVGRLACNTVGAGKMPEPEELLEYILREAAFKKDLSGKKVLVTAGATQEAIDPVRYITNHSTGKMGYAIARAAMLRGGEVTLVSGPSTLPAPDFVDFIPVKTAEDMYKKVTAVFENQDIVIMSAAVADYRPRNCSDQKIKKTDSRFTLELEKTQDILETLGKKKRPEQFLCGFAMETENLLENARKKMEKKNLNLIAANSLRTKGAGFAGDTNVITLLSRNEQVELPLMTKDEAAHELLNHIAAHL